MKDSFLRTYPVLFFLAVGGANLTAACSGSEQATTENETSLGGKGPGKGGSGGASTGQGGAGTGVGGSTAGSGGSSAGSAGTSTGSGGSNAGNGGSSSGHGGSSAGSGGSDAGSGGAGAGGAGGSTAGAGGSGGGAGGSEPGTGGSSAGSSGSDAGSGGSHAGSGGSDAGSGGNGGSGGEACVTQSTEATLKKKPVDILFVIDNSGSMTGEIIAVQNNINKNFAKIIEDSGLDYRVILIARHGTATSGQSICIGEPLSGAQCTCTAPNGPCSGVPPQPVNTEKFFHYSVEIGSTNSLTQITSTYAKKDEFGLAPNGWKQWLRKDAFKIFVEITDDNQAGAAADVTFDNALLAFPEGHFGTKEKRNYIFHSIIGIKAKEGTTYWPPTDPIQSGTCGSGAVNSGSIYQKLSILTGGLRFPICNNSSFDIVFKTIAEGVVEGSPVECAFPIPEPPDGKTIDPSTIVIHYTSGGGTEAKFEQVEKEACDAQSFYIQDGVIHLCPLVCGQVQSDPQAKLQLLYGCGKI
ncbi:MAG: VWA domain-containing protein [Myxococcales bacterium]|nr:VWA domain-containing protein [Polyangiaceae bacterium]MDW8248007.1 VWA domain-containing protein [Myxococcales bacterium]